MIYNWASIYGDPYGNLATFMARMNGRVYNLGPGGDMMTGTGRHDLIRAGAGGDRGGAGDGNDWVDLGPGDDSLHAGAGHDFVYGGEGNDSISGFWGNDILDGGPGKDRLGGRTGDDLIRGGDGNDIAYGDEGADTLLGEEGNDRLTGWYGSDMLYGAAGNDALFGDDEIDYLDGGGGDDYLGGGDNDDRLLAGDGNDRLEGDSGQDTLIAGSGNDLLSGGARSDRLEGGSGRDTHRGGEGNDTIVEEGVDASKVYGDSGNDHLVYRSGRFDAAAPGDLFAGSYNGGSGFDTLAITNDTYFLEFEGPELFERETRTEIHWSGREFVVHFTGGGSDDFPGRRGFTFTGVEQVELHDDSAIDFYASGLNFYYEYDRPLRPAPAITVVGTDATLEFFDAGWGGETFVTAGGEDLIDLRGPKDEDYLPITAGTRGSTVVADASDIGLDTVRGFGISPGDRILLRGLKADDVEVTVSSAGTRLDWGEGEMMIEGYTARAETDYFFV
jgi:Ca2+-binding RTX toxin-like protein